MASSNNLLLIKANIDSARDVDGSGQYHDFRTSLNHKIVGYKLNLFGWLFFFLCCVASCSSFCLAFKEFFFHFWDICPSVGISFICWISIGALVFPHQAAPAYLSWLRCRFKCGLSLPCFLFTQFLMLSFVIVNYTTSLCPLHTSVSPSVRPSFYSFRLLNRIL